MEFLDLDGTPARPAMILVPTLFHPWQWPIQSIKNGKDSAAAYVYLGLVYFTLYSTCTCTYVRSIGKKFLQAVDSCLHGCTYIKKKEKKKEKEEEKGWICKVQSGLI